MALTQRVTLRNTHLLPSLYSLLNSILATAAVDVAVANSAGETWASMLGVDSHKLSRELASLELRARSFAEAPSDVSDC